MGDINLTTFNGETVLIAHEYELSFDGLFNVDDTVLGVKVSNHDIQVGGSAHIEILKEGKTFAEFDLKEGNIHNFPQTLVDLFGASSVGHERYLIRGEKG